MAAGIPNELFWELTVDEVSAVLDERTQYERRANLRAGLVAAAMWNVNGGKDGQAVQAQDFFADPERDEYMTLDEAKAALSTWAKVVPKASSPGTPTP